MANLAINSTTNTILVDFGGYNTQLGVSKAVWRKEQVRFSIASDNSFINAVILTESDYAVSFEDTPNCLTIDTVNGQSPLSNVDLFDKLAALIA